ncbi:MAG: tetratricopeptide repeat protein [Planctomycetota bacterium]|jgi:tetratricopeptide (TPR) repeat protein
MREIVTTPGNRLVLYATGVCLVGVCLFAGFVYEPEVGNTVSDLEASIALYMHYGSLDAAKEDLEALKRLDPDNLYACLMEAYLCNESGEYQDALNHYKRARYLIEGHPDLEDDVWDAVCMLSLKTGLYRDAQAAAEERIELFGENVLSRLIIALSSFSRNDDKNFEENLWRALEMGINDPALNTKLETLISDQEVLINLYIESLLDRAEYELHLAERIWM